MNRKDKKKVITKKGLEKLKEELKRRTTVVRKEIADKLDEAKAIGDLSENSAYTSALEEYQLNEGKIRELKEQINAFVVAPDKSGDSTVDIGDKVKLKDLSTDSNVTYNIVGIGEGDPLSGQISADSTVGKALIGKRAGDQVTVDLPSGKKKYEILELL